MATSVGVVNPYATSVRTFNPLESSIEIEEEGETRLVLDAETHLERRQQLESYIQRRVDELAEQHPSCKRLTRVLLTRNEVNMIRSTQADREVPWMFAGDREDDRRMRARIANITHSHLYKRYPHLGLAVGSHRNMSTIYLDLLLSPDWIRLTRTLMTLMHASNRGRIKFPAELARLLKSYIWPPRYE